MDLRGFEPLTSSVRLKRAPNCATGPISKCKVFYFRQRGMSSRQGEIHFYILYITLSSAVHARVLKWTYQSDTNVSLLLLHEFDGVSAPSNSYLSESHGSASSSTLIGRCSPAAPVFDESCLLDSPRLDAYNHRNLRSSKRLIT